jgi:hypothetical protein
MPIRNCAPQRERVAEVLRQEEERFGETLEHGMAILERRWRAAKGTSTARPRSGCTTPTASRSTSPPTSAASAA